MKKHRVTKLTAALFLVCGIRMAMPVSMEVWAAETVTVQGSIMSGTTNDLLKLSTQEGNMEIKIDSGTDASACKVLLPGKQVVVSVSHGTDGYLHAAKITSGAQTESFTLDSSSNATITGTISEKSQEDVLCVNTKQGEMQIKLDPSTDMSGCSVLVVNRTYTITCARGSDAYMHATAIADAASGANSSVENGAQTASSSLTPSPASVVTASTSTVTGKVDRKTEEGLLYLSTVYGEMQVVIDSNTDTRNGMFMMPGREITVTVYRGSDAYMHAAVITGAKDTVVPASVDTFSTSTVSGTVNARSNENMLYLQTKWGEMELKLDTVKSMTGYKILTEDRKVTVTCARGADAYMHVVDLAGN